MVWIGEAMGPVDKGWFVKRGCKGGWMVDGEEIAEKGMAIEERL